MVTILKINQNVEESFTRKHARMSVSARTRTLHMNVKRGENTSSASPFRALDLQLMECTFPRD